MSAQRQTRETTTRRVRIHSAEPVSKASARRSLNLSLSHDSHKRLNALALLRDTTCSAIVEEWIASNSVGLVFHQRGKAVETTPHPQNLDTPDPL